MRFSFATLMMVALVAMPFASFSKQGMGNAQDKQSSPKNTKIKGKAPVNKDVLKVTLPKPYEATLKNGLSVLILENHKLPTFNMQIQISGAGDLYDPKDMPGLAALTAQMLREGTKTRTASDLAAAIDEMGASLGAGANYGSASTSINASGLIDNFDSLLDYMSDIIFNPTFPEKELSRIVANQKIGLQNLRTNPGFLANERFNKAVYGDHPASVRVTSAATLDKITPATLKEFRDSHYVAGNAILAISGDVDPKVIMPKLEKAFGSWAKGAPQEMKWPEPPTPNKLKIYLVDRPNSVQTDLTLGNLAISRTSPDYIALTVMNRVVGGGSTARLFMNLREDKGYTYGAYSGFNALQYAGTWSANSQVRTDVTEGSMKEFMYELNRIRDEKVSAKELEEVKRSLEASFALSLESPGALLSNAIVQKIYHLPANYWDTYTEKIAAITADDVQRVAKKYVGVDHLTIVAVGDASKIKDILAKYGEVEVYNVDGVKVGS